MSRGARIIVLTLLAAATLLPGGAAAEQAAQPASAAAGRLDVGEFHACAVLPSASLRCWGYGGDGALGYANRLTIGDDEAPAAAGPVNLGAGRTAVAVSAGSVHTCALQDDGAVRCWGFAAEGRVGYGNITQIGDDEAPGSAGPVDLGAGRTAKAITAGGGHSCAVLDDGTVRCWGYGFDGRLGYGTQDTIGDTEDPGDVGPVKLGAGRTAKAVTAGDNHTCAVLDDGTVRCWGRPGQLGLGPATPVNANGAPAPLGDDETPDQVGPVDLGPGRTAVAISAGDLHTCAVLDNGTVRCWGLGDRGRLGYGNTNSIGDDETPAAAGPVDLGPGRTAVAISAGAEHTCALLDDGTARCWGFGGNGRLGYANTATIGDDETPGSVAPVDLGTGRTAVAISTGGDITCARLDDGGVRCWGRGTSGRLGSCSADSIGDDESPGSVGPIDLGAPGTPPNGCRSTGDPPPPTPYEVPLPPGAAPPGGEPLPEDPAPASSQQARARALRSCLQRVSREARQQRRRAGRKRAAARRRIGRRAARGRNRCRRRHSRSPGRVTGVSARSLSLTKVVLSFRAPTGNGSRPPAARGYLIKQSRRPIRGARGFRRAQTLCGGRCRFDTTAVGARLRLTINRLQPRTAYYYALAARDNVTSRTGPRSATVRVRTR